MELLFRQRLDRSDKLGRAVVFGDLHGAGAHRWKVPTGVKVLIPLPPRVKRDKVPDAARLAAAEPWLAAASGTYRQAPARQRAVRQDAALRFAGLGGH